MSPGGWIFIAVLSALIVFAIAMYNRLVALRNRFKNAYAHIDVQLKRGVSEEALWLSMERNMQCGAGRCGHCQMGGKFVCKDGPVFNYPDVKALLGVKGF